VTTEANAAPAAENTTTQASAPDSNTATSLVTGAPATEAVKPAEATTETPATEPAAPPVKEEAKAPEVKPTERVTPEKYEFKAPEGTQLDPELVGTFETTAKELGLTQSEAQTLVEKMAPQMVAAQEAARTAVVTQWTADAKSDKEFGGDKLNENLAVAKKALDAVGTPELKELLEKTGLGNNPEIIRAFYRVGKQISTGSFVQGGKAPVSQSGNAASKLYPDMP